ncbi:toxin-antitoxin system HicB family antitoxin [Vagococcus fluvialis]|uniref:toxin-antitoxin system HicB family antitoxin n=1 Tax=Vagococcus fluvialis TaxID=2738 RepID=UPI003B5BC2B5
MTREYLSKLQYGYTIQPFEDEYFNGFIGRYNDLPVEVYGETEEQTLEDLKFAKEEFFATCIKENTVDRIPNPTVSNDSEYSGRVTARLGKSLHRRLAEYAEYDGVSLNQAIQMLIERGMQETNINRFDKKLDKTNESQEKIAKELVTINLNKSIDPTPTPTYLSLMEG